MRNGADALMRLILSALGVNGLYWMGVLFLIGFLMVYFIQYKYWEETPINVEYLFLRPGKVVNT